MYKAEVPLVAKQIGLPNTCGGDTIHVQEK